MCTKTCKQGKQSRTRECDTPAPLHGGKKCDGEGKETQMCNEMVPCPGNMCLTVCLYCCIVEIIYYNLKIETSWCSHTSNNVWSFKLMVIGDNGVSGALVQRVANKENNQEHVNVIHQLHDMVERNVKASPRIQEFVTRKYHVQVISIVARLSIEVEHCSKGTPWTLQSFWDFFWWLSKDFLIWNQNYKRFIP